jgi:hypothetical protein
MPNRVYLWRSELAQRLYGEIADREEQRRFVRLLTLDGLTDEVLRVFSDLWEGMRLPGESLMTFLDRAECIMTVGSKGTNSTLVPELAAVR